MKISEPRLIELPKISDPRGNLSFIEEDTHIPFQISEVLIFQNTSDIESYFNRSYKKNDKLIVVLKGNIDVTAFSNKKETFFNLCDPNMGVWLPRKCRVKMRTSSLNLIVLVVES